MTKRVGWREQHDARQLHQAGAVPSLYQFALTTPQTYHDTFSCVDPRPSFPRKRESIDPGEGEYGVIIHNWYYVRAVASRVGHDLSITDVDYRGIDGTIENPLLRSVNRVDFQLKSTTDYEFRGTDVIYDLRVDDYNRLIRDLEIPRVLILFTMPDDEAEWLVQSPDELCLRRCAYWVSLMGEDFSNNTSTVRVSLPQANVFDQDGLRDMFTHLGLIR